MRHIWENRQSWIKTHYHCCLLVLCFAKVVACWILRNVIFNLIILHLHINWIGNIKITWKCKCNRIELKVQFKSKLSYLWIHSCEATQLYLTDLKIKLSTKKTHIKERWDVIIHNIHTLIRSTVLCCCYLVLLKDWNPPLMHQELLDNIINILYQKTETHFSECHTTHAIWTSMFVCIIMVIIFVLKMYLHNNLHKQLSSTKRRKRGEGDGGSDYLIYGISCPPR